MTGATPDDWMDSTMQFPDDRVDAPAPKPIEIWIRKVGARRQAFCRMPGTSGWRAMPVPQADKALRAGKLASGPHAGACVVPRETAEASEPPPQQHPMHAGFVAQAAAINQSIDAMFGDARTPA